MKLWVQDGGQPHSPCASPSCLPPPPQKWEQALREGHRKGRVCQGRGLPIREGCPAVQREGNSPGSVTGGSLRLTAQPLPTGVTPLAAQLPPTLMAKVLLKDASHPSPGQALTSPPPPTGPSELQNSLDHIPRTTGDSSNVLVKSTRVCSRKIINCSSESRQRLCGIWSRLTQERVFEGRALSHTGSAQGLL